MTGFWDIIFWWLGFLAVGAISVLGIIYAVFTIIDFVRDHKANRIAKECAVKQIQAMQKRLEEVFALIREVRDNQESGTPTGKDAS